MTTTTAAASTNISAERSKSAFTRKTTSAPAAAAEPITPPAMPADVIGDTRRRACAVVSSASINVQNCGTIAVMMAPVAT
jgi:hypothetical protein